MEPWKAFLVIHIARKRFVLVQIIENARLATSQHASLYFSISGGTSSRWYDRTAGKGGAGRRGGGHGIHVLFGGRGRTKKATRGAATAGEFDHLGDRIFNANCTR